MKTVPARKKHQEIPGPDERGLKKGKDPTRRWDEYRKSPFRGRQIITPARRLQMKKLQQKQDHMTPAKIDCDHLGGPGGG